MVAHCGAARNSTGIGSSVCSVEEEDYRRQYFLERWDQTKDANGRLFG
jgi:hypothetical protein